MKTPSLFDRPPFSINQYILERNEILKVEHPKSAAELEAQSERIRTGISNFDEPIKSKKK